MPKQDRIPELVEEMRHYFADVPLVMEAADTIEDLMDVVEHYKEFYHEEHDLRIALIEKTKKEGGGVGKWIDKPYFTECSVCHAEFDSEVTCSEIYGWPWVYCPKCGARLEVSGDA